jgi:ATP-binding cassette subfamily C (CFTR/MRP) protein 10
MLISPLNSFPWVINGLVQALVSFKRLKNFLNLHNLDWLTYYSYSQLNGEIESNIKLEINNADFKWKLNDDSSDALALTELDFEVKQGQLIGIVGKG